MFFFTLLQLLYVHLFVFMFVCSFLCNLSYKQETMEAIDIFNKNTLEQSHHHFPIVLFHIICNLLSRNEYRICV